MIVDVQLNLVTTGAEFENHREEFSRCIRSPNLQTDCRNMSRQKRLPTLYRCY